MKVTSFGCYWCNPLVSSWETNVQSGSFFAYLPCQSQSRPQIRSVHPLHILSMSILNILLDDRFPQHQHSKLLRFKSRHHHGRLYFLDDQRHRDDCLVAELPTRAILLAEQSSQERQKVGRLIRIMMMMMIEEFTVLNTAFVSVGPCLWTRKFWLGGKFLNEDVPQALGARGDNVPPKQ